MHITLGGEETIVTSAHLGEGLCDELWFWKVIGVPEDVREGRQIGGKQSMAIEDATVCKCLAVLFCPGMNDVVILLVSQLSQVTKEKGRGRGRWEETKRGAEAGNDDGEEGPQTVENRGGGEDEKRGKQGKRER